MAGLYRFVSRFHQITHNLLQKQAAARVLHKRCIHPTTSLQMREVVESTEGNVTVVEGRVFESTRKGFVVNTDGPKHACPLCRLNMNINYTDVMIISQFVQEDGEIVPRQVTGLCYSQHTRMRQLIRQSHRAGLMQHLRPHLYPDEYHQMSDFAWKRYNTYFTDGLDEENKH